MTIAEKHGFVFTSVPEDAPIVAMFIRDHIARFNLPDDARSVADHWVAVCKPPGVYALFGWRLVDDKGGIRADVSDFYTYPGRLGTLAAYAALERIRAMSDQWGVPVLTATPASNTAMIRAIQRAFDVKSPSHIVNIHYPVAAEKEQVA